MDINVLKERELCCQDVCAACAIAAGLGRPEYGFWLSVSEAHYGVQMPAIWSHSVHYSNGSKGEAKCYAYKIRERGKQ